MTQISNGFGVRSSLAIASACLLSTVSSGYSQAASTTMKAAPIESRGASNRRQSRAEFSSSNFRNYIGASGLKGFYPDNGHYDSAFVTSNPALVAVSPRKFVSDSIRQTSDHERAIAEIRGWISLPSDWDGEGAKSPVTDSIMAAAKFICAMPRSLQAPEPMLHANGKAGLAWHEDDAYGEIEFQNDGSIVYFFNIKGNRHKGEMSFNAVGIPVILEDLISKIDVVKLQEHKYNYSI